MRARARIAIRAAAIAAALAIAAIGPGTGGDPTGGDPAVAAAGLPPRPTDTPARHRVPLRIAASATAADPAPASPGGAAARAPRDLGRRLAGIRPPAPRAPASAASGPVAGTPALAPFRPREAPSALRLALLEAIGALRVEREAFEIAGVRHTPYVLHKHGLPVLNRRGRLHERGGEPLGAAGGVSLPPIVSDARFAFGREAAIAAARAAAGVASLRAAPRVERGWFARPGGSLPAWRVTLPAREPLASFQVTLDARSGEVLVLVDLLRSVDGAGLVHDPNPAEAPTPSLVSLRALDGSGHLAGDVTRVFDLEEVEAFSVGLDFQFPTDDPRFVQTSVYRGLTDTGLFAAAHGFPAFAESILAFTNLDDPGTGGEYNNAFYDPSIPVFGFGNGDGVVLANLGKDLDVAAHEMGHHVFEQLVQPEIFSLEDPVLAMHEAVADLFAGFVGGDAAIGESTLPGSPQLRTLANTRSFPDDRDPDPHETGLIFGGATWDLLGKLGRDELASTLIAALPFLPPDAFEVDYRDALLDADLARTGGRNAKTIRKSFSKRGFDELEIPPEYQGEIADGVPEMGFLADGAYHYYVFFEFPGSTALSFQLTGTGDADLVVGTEDFDPNVPQTFKASENWYTSNESVLITTSSTPSTLASDTWLAIVPDFPDFGSSSYTLTVNATLPANGVAIDGPPAGGEIGPVGEVDFFAFSGSAGQVVRVEGTGVDPHLDPLVAVLTLDGAELLAWDDDSGPGTDSLIQGVELPATGRYALVVLSLAADLDPRIGTGAYQVQLSTCANMGDDTDGDGLVDACDDDDDQDEFKDEEDAAPLDPAACADYDGDGCDDCSSGAFDFFDDGPDADGDGACDPGDGDDDNDGCGDDVDPQPEASSEDPDLDFLGGDCDNCPEAPNPTQDDVDSDGRGDACSTCARLAWSDPPASPPDQNPAGSSVVIGDLLLAGQSVTGHGSFNPAMPVALDPSISGAHLRLADPDGALWEVGAPPGAVGSSPCNALDGWSLLVKKGVATWSYANLSGALASEGCAPGSAQGLRSLSLVGGASGIDYTFAAVSAPLARVPDSVPRFLQLDLVLGSSPGPGLPGAAGEAGLCAESVLRAGGLQTSCQLSVKKGVLQSLACGAGKSKKKKKPK